MIRIVAVMILLLTLGGCEKCDDLTGAACVLEEKLGAYEKFNNPEEVIDWVAKYHGEAPGSELMNRFVYWGNRNIAKMDALLSSWPDESKEEVLNRLLWAAKNSGQTVNFSIELNDQENSSSGAEK